MDIFRVNIYMSFFFTYLLFLKDKHNLFIRFQFTDIFDIASTNLNLFYIYSLLFAFYYCYYYCYSFTLCRMCLLPPQKISSRDFKRQNVVSMRRLKKMSYHANVEEILSYVTIVTARRMWEVPKLFFFCNLPILELSGICATYLFAPFNIFLKILKISITTVNGVILKVNVPFLC